ncbi:MAG: bifunctional adenosylcobinamide kinase/adenosylcobinamide-phosphate guanylyltransferase [Candidatus Tectomicrobia bacterium]|uniref:Adenosylcobinamide kinase n=1 Tax=Tectimicrobiota bacterium TaxID=2528274 RepID=A0A937W5V0_UNCTE|nr:bifunctional adenosylcobinamide kinase/adenosylcobinamide-phosphate guanylyltransferase [Candidatus Tectomicrobia bacterium]
MGRLCLILGGARSGKSAYAQRLAEAWGGEHVLFVATAEAWDEDMAQRIARHQQERPSAWRTLEMPRQVGHALARQQGDAPVVVVDCLTLLVSNALLALGEAPDPAAATAAVHEEVTALLQTCQASRATYLVVSNEVGLGLVPDNPLGRLYRDLLGKANQTLAAHATAVYWMVAGLPVDVKALASPSIPSPLVGYEATKG